MAETDAEGACHRCGRPIAAHDTDPYTGAPTKCPVRRQDRLPGRMGGRR